MSFNEFDIDIFPMCVTVYERCDNDFIFVGFNKIAEEVEKINRNEVLGKSLSKIYPQYKEVAFFEALNRVYETENSELVESSFYVDGLRYFRKNEIKKLPNAKIIVFSTNIDKEKKLINKFETSNNHHVEVKSLEKELLEQRNFLTKVFDLLPSLLWLKDTDGKYINCNSGFERFMGRQKEQIIGKTDYDLVDKEKADWFRKYDNLSLKYGESNTNEEYLIFADGSCEGYFETVKTPIKNLNEEVTGVIGLAHNVSERKAREEQLKIYANYDTLTGLANRTLLIERLTHLTKKRVESKKISALLFIDLDHFKEINDSMGHLTGDIVLVEIAKRLKKIIRKGDTIARLGGDEFIILFEDINSCIEAGNLARKILTTIKEPLKIKEHQFFLSSSIGIVIYPDDSTDAQKLLSYADSAMYKAKDKGRDCFEFYTKELSDLVLNRILVENSLRKALENDEFVLFYQPQVDVIFKKILGAEALIRWKKNATEFVSPAKFIPIAELSGLIIPIGKWVIQQAMKDSIKIKEANPDIENISINLSVKQLSDMAIVDIIKEALISSNCDPKSIEFEITESYAMGNTDEVEKTLNDITKLGCKISIDDFGTGYSSLSYLKKLPIQKIKIDQSFVQDIPGSNDDESIVNAVILIAKSMQMEVIAEGIEHSTQQDFLLEHGCMLSQGYFYAKPMPIEEFKNYSISNKFYLE